MSMDVTPYLVDWEEAKRRTAAGTLGDDVFEALEKEAPWIQTVEWDAHSFGWYNAVADAWEHILGTDSYDLDFDSESWQGRIVMGWLQIRGTKGVPWFMDRRARKFIKPLITHEGYCFDLGESEDFALSIGPASANGFVRLAKGVDFTLYRDSFYKNVSESDQENLTEWAGGELTECFERGFLDYIHIWVETLKVAAQRQQGLLIQWG